MYKVPAFTSTKEMLEEVAPDIAIVAVPHSSYIPVIELLAQKKINIIKEKPFAINIKQALELEKIIKKYNIFMGVTLQRRFNPIFQSFLQLKNQIGKIYSIEGRYTMNIKDLSEGWRASNKYAGGGALIDMGYHYIDLLVWYMGVPNTITAKLSRGNRLNQAYDVEDTINLLFDYHTPTKEEKIIGNFIISRTYPHKEESLKIYGTNGSIELKRGEIKQLNAEGEVVESLSRIGSWPSALISQLDYFSTQIELGKSSEYSYRTHFKHVAIIEAAYRSDKINNSVSPQEIFHEFNIGDIND